ncbi:unnamed protein product [Owenia fusiformis]|uniref:Uncharacterized protein n=1 Tax=Owenia fusiformis TaxID=6347 RepID=A0A8J1UV70_OWEFU|nr:unnamed protein product [Owenia fusiformis]
MAETTGRRASRTVQSLKAEKLPNIQQNNSGHLRKSSLLAVPGRRMSHAPANRWSVSYSNDGGSETSHPSTSIAGLLASKKFANHLKRRVSHRRASNKSHSADQIVSLEPSYRMEPKTAFNTAEVKLRVDAILSEKLHSATYTPASASAFARMLPDVIKAEIKLLGYERYKIICHLTIGENQSQGLGITSRCVWNEKADSFSSSVFKNGSIFCSAIVFGVYVD